MNDGFNYYNLYSARNSQKSRLHQYMTTDYNNIKRHSTSINNKRCSSHKNTINLNTLDDEGNFIINQYNQKNRGSDLFNYFKDNNYNIRRQKKNLMKMSSSSSYLNTIQNNFDLQQHDLLIHKLHKELNQKNLQLYNRNNVINDYNTGKKSEKINVSNNIFSNNKVNQINNTIYNLKKNSINKELTMKLRENKNFYKKIIDLFNDKLSEIQSKNLLLIKQNQNLKSEIFDSKQKYKSFKTKKYISIKPSHEIKLTFNKTSNYLKNNENDEKIIKLQKLISIYKSKNFNLTKEINLLKNDIKNKSNQIMNVKNQFNSGQNKLNEIFNDVKIKEAKIQKKDREIENKRNEINALNNKISQLLTNFEKEKKEKIKIQQLYENTFKEIENNKNEIEKIKLENLSQKNKLNNISSISHKIIFNKNIPKYKLGWSLITVKKETEIKNYLNTFWISEEDKKFINGNLSFESIDLDIDEDKESIIKDIDKNNEVIKKLNNIIEEKDKIIIQLKNKSTDNENEIINNSVLKNNNNDKDKNGFVSMDKYIKIVNQLSEAKIKMNELMNEKNNKNLNINTNNNLGIKNFNMSDISEELSDFMKNEDNGNNIRIFGENKNNKINLNNSNDTNKYLEKYIDDLENKLEKIKNLLKILIQEMEYTSNINNTLYNLLIVSGYDDQEAVYIIQEKQKKNIKKTNFKK